MSARDPSTSGPSALALGLAAGPRAPVVLLVALVVIPLVSAGPAAALAALVALACGAGVAQARLAVLDRSSLETRAGHAVDARAVALETPRATAFGWRAIASLGGERVLLRGSGPAPPLSTGDLAQVRGGLRGLGPHDGWLRTRHVHTVAAGRRRPLGRETRRGARAGRRRAPARSAGAQLGDARAAGGTAAGDGARRRRDHDARRPQRAAAGGSRTSRRRQRRQHRAALRARAGRRVPARAEPQRAAGWRCSS